MSTITSATLSVVFSIVYTFIKIILAPIDSLIMRFLPDVNTMISKLSDFLNLCFGCVGWVIDAFGIPAGAISLIISYFVLKYSIHFASIGIKIIIGWVKALK